jgi:hypothetical protein
MFPSSGEGRETPTLLGPLGRASLNHWTGHHRQNPSGSTRKERIWRIHAVHWIQHFQYTVQLVTTIINMKNNGLELRKYVQKNSNPQTPYKRNHLER